MSVVSNTGPLIALAKIDQLELLEYLLGRFTFHQPSKGSFWRKLVPRLSGWIAHLQRSFTLRNAPAAT